MKEKLLSNSGDTLTEQQAIYFLMQCIICIYALLKWIKVDGVDENIRGATSISDAVYNVRSPNNPLGESEQHFILAVSGARTHVPLLLVCATATLLSLKSC